MLIKIISVPKFEGLFINCPFSEILSPSTPNKPQRVDKEGYGCIDVLTSWKNVPVMFAWPTKHDFSAIF